LAKISTIILCHYTIGLRRSIDIYDYTCPGFLG
jgi:hypothetical protein